MELAGSDPVNLPLPDACGLRPKGSEVTASSRQLRNAFSAGLGRAQDKSTFAELLVRAHSLDVSAERTWRPATSGFLCPWVSASAWSEEEACPAPGILLAALPLPERPHCWAGTPWLRARGAFSHCNRYLENCPWVFQGGKCFPGCGKQSPSWRGHGITQV